MPPRDYEVHDDRFRGLIQTNAHIEVLCQGGRWLEGPAYFPAGKYLIFSDIPGDRVMRWDETDGNVSTFLSPCGYHNGHSVDPQGRLVSCEHQGRRITRIEHDGTITSLSDRFEGKRLNSPNDIVVKSDGTVWFTDPTYGIDSDYEGDAAPSEIGENNVYRIGLDGKLTKVAGDLRQPNGLAFSPDEKILYISDTGQTHDPDCAPVIRAYPVTDDRLGAGQAVATSDCGLFDGFRIDFAGRIWTSAGDGVHCYAPDGTLLGKILIDEVVANLTFGGPKRNRLYICATTTLRAVCVNTAGATWPLA